MTTTNQNQIRAWRGVRSQEWAARELRVALRTFQRWERGEVTPRGYQREKLEAALNSGTKLEAK